MPLRQFNDMILAVVMMTEIYGVLMRHWETMMELVTKGSQALSDMVSYMVQILSMSWYARCPDCVQVQTISPNDSPITKLTLSHTTTKCHHCQD